MFKAWVTAKQAGSSSFSHTLLTVALILLLLLSVQGPVLFKGIAHTVPFNSELVSAPVMVAAQPTALCVTGPMSLQPSLPPSYSMPALPSLPSWCVTQQPCSLRHSSHADRPPSPHTPHTRTWPRHPPSPHLPPNHLPPTSTSIPPPHTHTR